MSRYPSYPKPWPGYTVPEFGGRLNGLRGDEPDILPSSYPESTFSVEQLSGFTDWVSGAWDLLAGKSQSWYDRLDRDQKALAARQAEIATIGQEAWDMVRGSYLETTQGPDVDFLSFQDIQGGINDNLRSLIVTEKHIPSDADISSAEAFNAQYGRYVDYVKSILPELAAQVADAAAQVQAALSKGTMKSPAAVGQQVFVDEVERRAKVLGAVVGGSILLYLAAGLGIALALSAGGRK